jgi:hypothetical protein
VDLAATQTLVGRGASATVRIDAPSVSDQHMRVVLDATSGNYWLEDMRSRTGTLRNGAKVAGKVWLADGDRIMVGATTIVFRSGAPAAARAPARPGVEAGATVVAAEPPEAVKELIRQRDAAERAAARARAEASEPHTVETELPEMRARPGVAHGPGADARPHGRTKMGIGDEAPTVVPDEHNPFSTHVEMRAPVLPPVAEATGELTTPYLPDEKNPFATQAEMQAPKLPPTREIPSRPGPAAPPRPAAQKGPSSKGAPFAATAAMEAPTGFAGSSGFTPAPGAVAQPQFARPGFAVQRPAPGPGALPNAPTAIAPQPGPPGSRTVQGTPMSSPYGAMPSPATAPMPMVGGPPAPAQGVDAGWGQPAPQMGAEPPTGAIAAGPPMTFGQGPPLQFSQAGYAAPDKKGPLGSLSRALTFYTTMFKLAFQHKALLAPLIYDLGIATAVSVVISVLFLFVESPGFFWLLLSLGTGALYFIDYACNSLTASLIYDQVTTGHASTKAALPRVKKALGGIMIFASVSAALDVATTYARERHDIVSRILLDILRKIWTTATYVIMPSLVLEGLPFGAAFKRSKELMAQDPTGVGAGIVAMSLSSYIVGAVVFPLAYFMLRLGWAIHLPTVGALLFFTLVNLYWAVSGWMKISYSTMFYLWASECAKAQQPSNELAPLPLRTALEAA